jgi:hypothetical protein
VLPHWTKQWGSTSQLVMLVPVQLIHLGLVSRVHLVVTLQGAQVLRTPPHSTKSKPEVQVAGVGALQVIVGLFGPQSLVALQVIAFVAAGAPAASRGAKISARRSSSDGAGPSGSAFAASVVQARSRMNGNSLFMGFTPFVSRGAGS